MAATGYYLTKQARAEQAGVTSNVEKFRVINMVEEANAVEPAEEQAHTTSVEDDSNLTNNSVERANATTNNVDDHALETNTNVDGANETNTESERVDATSNNGDHTNIPHNMFKNSDLISLILAREANESGNNARLPDDETVNNYKQAPIEFDQETNDVDVQLRRGNRKFGGQDWRQMMADIESLRTTGLRLIKPLGSGIISTVYEARDWNQLFDGKPKKVTIKAMNWSAVLGYYQRHIYSNVVKMYEMLPSHPNIVDLLARHVDGSTTFLVYEWCPLGTLRQGLGPEGCFGRGVGELLARRILKEICCGLQFLYDNAVCHGRLTTDNVLLGEQHSVKLRDFGFPPSTNSNSSDDAKHLLYRAPELLRMRPHKGTTADIWSLGVVMYEMLHATPPYSLKVLVRADKMTSLPDVTYRAALTYHCILFNKRLLTFSPMFRPDLRTVFADPWMVKTPAQPRKNHMSCYHDQVQTDRVSPPVPHSSSTHPDTCEPPASKPSPTQQTRDGSLKGDEWGTAKHYPPTICTDRPEALEELPAKYREVFCLCKACHHSKLCGPDKDATAGENSGQVCCHSAPGTKMCPRVSAMFRHYVPNKKGIVITNQRTSSKPDLQDGAAEEKKTKEKGAVNPMTEKMASDQLAQFIKYSERMRLKFYRKSGFLDPRGCKNYPLPPLMIITF